MNLKAYYQKIREIEESLVQPFVVIVSRDTPDGGRGGLLTEVPRWLAARMIADGRAHLASEDAAREFHDKKVEAKRMAASEGAATKMQATLVPTAEVTNARRQTKE